MCACVVERRDKDSDPEHSGFVLPEHEECATAHGPGGKDGGKSLTGAGGMCHCPWPWRKGPGQIPDFSPSGVRQFY